MSYDIKLTHPITGELLELDRAHQIKGGTYAMGGTSFAELNVTYNYYKHFRRVFGESGIRSIYGKTGAETIPLFENAISELKDDVHDDYWKATEGNAQMAIHGLLALARLRPDGVWAGD